MSAWWLSFADPARAPAGFLGVAIVHAEGLGEALARATATGCNPGGEVQGMALREDVESRLPDAWYDRLLTRAETEEVRRLLARG